MTNIIIISGRITKDLALLTSNSGTAYCRFSIANDVGFGDKKKTNFVDVTAFGKTAENLCKYRGKGNLVTIEGTLEQNSYTDKEGNKKSSYNISARNIEWDWDSTQKMPVDKPTGEAPSDYFPADADNCPF